MAEPDETLDTDIREPLATLVAVQECAARIEAMLREVLDLLRREAGTGRLGHN